MSDILVLQNEISVVTKVEGHIDVLNWRTYWINQLWTSCLLVTGEKVREGTYETIKSTKETQFETVPLETATE